jgi:hypothetical protein
VLERVGAIVGLARLPTRLTYRLKECAGELNAWCLRRHLVDAGDQFVAEGHAPVLGRVPGIQLPGALLETVDAPGTGLIRVVYEAPKKAAYREIYDSMRRQRVLERVGAIVGLARWMLATNS